MSTSGRKRLNCEALARRWLVTDDITRIWLKRGYLPEPAQIKPRLEWDAADIFLLEAKALRALDNGTAGGRFPRKLLEAVKRRRAAAQRARKRKSKPEEVAAE